MAGSYQLVPYLVRFGVPGRADEYRPLDDINGAGLSAHDAMAKAFVLMLGRERASDGKGTDQTITIESVHQGEHCLLVTATSGTRGMTGALRPAEGPKIAIGPDDSTDLPLRHVFLTPHKGKVGLLLVERFGNRGVISLLSKMLKEILLTRLNVRVEIDAAMSEKAMNRWAEQAKIKAILLHRVSTRDGMAAPATYLPAFRLAMPRRKWWSWDRFRGTQGEVDAKKLIGALLPELPVGSTEEDADTAAQHLLDEGWRVALELRKDQKSRQFHVHSKTGITLSYPLGDDGAAGQTSDEAFLAACQAVIEELRESGVVDLVQEADCEWPEEAAVENGFGGDWGVEPSAKHSAGPAGSVLSPGS